MGEAPSWGRSPGFIYLLLFLVTISWQVWLRSFSCTTVFQLLLSCLDLQMLPNLPAYPRDQVGSTPYSSTRSTPLGASLQGATATGLSNFSLYYTLSPFPHLKLILTVCHYPKEAQWGSRCRSANFIYKPSSFTRVYLLSIFLLERTVLEKMWREFILTTRWKQTQRCGQGFVSPPSIAHAVKNDKQ